MKSNIDTKEKELDENLLVTDTMQELNEVMPAMNVNVPTVNEEAEPSLITDDALLGVYGEILDNIRSDRKEIDNLLSNFVEMVINEGDSTSASKEALVNLVKIKSESADKMAKIADLMTRVKLKERDTFPRYLAAHQNNTINIGDNGNKRELLKQIERAKKKQKEKL